MSDLVRENTLGRKNLRRRSFLKSGALSLLLAAFPRRAFSFFTEGAPSERALRLYNVHTGEYLETVYRARGEYIPQAQEKIDYILRDYRTGEVRSIDARLLDLLYYIGWNLEAKHPFHIISGYRSMETNLFLWKRNRGVAKNSLHILGKAVDINLPDCDLPLLRGAAVEQKAGGVGYYPRSNFIHIDVGRVRYW